MERIYCRLKKGGYKKVKGYPKTEYAVEINNERGFVRQIDVFNTYDKACDFANNYDGDLLEDEYLNIIFIDYDENGDEIGFSSVV